MKKFILSVVLLATLNITAKAQMPYDLTTSTSTYQPLTSGTVISDAKAWNEDSLHIVQIPFSFSVNGKTAPMIVLSGGSLAVTDTGTADAFGLVGTGLVDRGLANVDSLSKSPVRVQLTGVAGSRIFKIEVANAGFVEELDFSGTTNDSLNIQLWLYETSNIVEIHFGSSKVSDFNGYFPTGMLCGFMNNINVGMGTFDKFYLLTGSASAPVVDTMTASSAINGMTSYPASGRVYRFTPKSSTTSIAKSNKLAEMKVYPTQCHDVVMVDNPNEEELNYSIVGMDGSVRKTGKLMKGHNQLGVAELPSGMYLLRVDDSVYGAVKRIVKL